MIHQVFTSGENLRVREAVNFKSGEVKYFDTLKWALRDSEGETFQTVGVSRLIQKEELINQAETLRGDRKRQLRELRILVENTPVALAMLDIHGRLLARSEAWVRLFAPISGENMESYDGELERALPLARQNAEVLSSGKAQELLSQRFSESEKIVNVQIQPWSLSGETIGGTIVLIIDITQRERARREALRSSNELADLIYHLSHSLNGPIRSILGMARVSRECLEEGKNTVALQASEHIHNESRRMLERLKSLEVLFRLSQAQEKGGSLPVIQQVELCIAKLCQKYPPLNSRLRTKVGESVGSLPGQLMEILSQLLENAFLHSETESPISLTLERLGKVAVLSVESVGPPINQGEASTVFEMFQRSSKRGSGFGLGLYLVRRLCKLLGGDVTYRRVEGHNLFVARLPGEAS